MKCPKCGTKMEPKSYTHDESPDSDWAIYNRVEDSLTTTYCDECPKCGFRTPEHTHVG